MCVCVVLTRRTARSMLGGFTRIKGLLKSLISQAKLSMIQRRAGSALVPFANVKYGAPGAGCYSTEEDYETSARVPHT